MTSSTSPQDDNNPLAIQIDDELLAEALKSVERHQTPRKPATPLEEPVEEQGVVEFDLGNIEADLSRDQSGQDDKDKTIEQLLRANQDLEQQRAAMDHLTRKLRVRIGELEDELDRLHQRSAKDRDYAQKFGHENTLREFLPVMDSLSRARKHANADPLRFVQGFGMVVDQFQKVLVKLGLERIPASPGTPFNPDLHEAILQVSTSDEQPGRIVDEARAGWLLSGRLLRAAQVAIAIPSTPKDPTPEAESAEVPS